MRNQQIDLSLKRARRDRYIEVRLTDVSIPLRNLVFKNAMISERVPCQTADVTVILVRIISAMREDDIRIRSRLQHLEPRLDCFPLFPEEPVAKPHHHN